MGSGGPPFIDRQVFGEMLTSISTAAGGAYQDVPTIYGDMSRLVVAWLASMEPDEIKGLYNELGWGGSANARAIHAAAREWMQRYRRGAGANR